MLFWTASVSLAHDHERARRSRSGRPSVLVVELRRLLRGLEELRIVTDEQLGVLDIADVADAIVATIGIARTPRAGNRRGQGFFGGLPQGKHHAGSAGPARLCE